MKSRGFGLIEIVVASAVIAAVVVAIVGALQMYIKMANTSGLYAQAALLTEESSEVLQLFRDKGWTANIAPLTLNTTYYLYWDGNQYLATTTIISVQNYFFRTVFFSSVTRDSSDNISTTGTVDPNTRKVTVTILLATTTPSILSKSDFLIHNVYNN